MPTDNQNKEEVIARAKAEQELKAIADMLKKQRKEKALDADAIASMQAGIKSALSHVDMNSSRAMKNALAVLKTVKKQAENIADESWQGKKEYLNALDASIKTYEANTLSMGKMMKGVFGNVPNIKDLVGGTLKAAFPLLGATAKFISDSRKQEANTKKALADAIKPLVEEQNKTKSKSTKEKLSDAIQPLVKSQDKNTEQLKDNQKATETENRKAKNPKSKRDAPLVSRMEALRVQATIQTKLLEALYKVWDGDVTSIEGLTQELELANQQVAKFNNASLKQTAETVDSLDVLVAQNKKMLENEADATRKAEKLALQQLELQKEANAKKLDAPTLQKAGGNKEGSGGILGMLLGGILGFVAKVKMLSNLISKEGMIGKLFSKIPFVDDLVKLTSKTGVIGTAIAKVASVFSTTGIISKVISKIGSIGGVFGKIGGWLSPIFKSLSGLGGLLRTGLSAGKGIPIVGQVIMAIFAIFDFFKGFSKENAAKKLGKEKVDFRDRLSSGIGAVLGGIVGIIDEVAGWFGINTKMGGKTISEWVDWGVTNVLSIVLHPIDSLKSLWTKIKAIDFGKYIDIAFNAILHPFDTLISLVDMAFGTNITGFIESTAKQITDKVFGLWDAIKESFLSGIKKLAEFYIDNAPDAIIPDSVYKFAGRNPDGSPMVEPVRKTNTLVEMENKQAKESAARWVNQNMTNIAAPVTNNVNTSNATFMSGNLQTRNSDRTFNKSNLYYSPSDSW